MKQRSELLDRAKMTVERTALLLRDLRDELDGTSALNIRDQHASWDLITDLEWRHSLLSDFYLDMLLSAPSQMEDRWERFSICYDDYRQAVREARFELAHLNRDGPAREGRGRAPPPPREDGGARPRFPSGR